VRGQNNHQHVTQELINMQLVTVQLTQLSKSTLEVVQVLNGLSKGGQHLLAMSLDLGVAHDGRGRGHVAKTVKESLGPGVNNKDFTSSLFYIQLAPQATDNALLLSIEIHHDVRTVSLLVITEVSEVGVFCLLAVTPFILHWRNSESTDLQ
uniref:Uncharacterized protein n=1 Tax=Sciurus vulgaris TaxID=55149 RepID=A0A8D2AW06_SCIVU